MASHNTDCQRHGFSYRATVNDILELTKELGYITEIFTDYKKGKPGYTDTNQFKVPYMISFSDNTKWLIFTTTSLRERIKAAYWDSLNLKTLDSSITQAFLVYPDTVSASDKKSFIAKKKKILSHGEYATLEDIMSQDQLFNVIENYALKDKTPAQIRDIRGNNFEKRTAAILSNISNFEKWQTDDSTLEGMHYEIFQNIINCFGLDKLNTLSISATADKSIIGLLPSGGPVKTDVICYVEDTQNNVDIYTISCKRSSQTSVSIHQYNADSFSNVLDPSNTELRDLLNLFQTCGNKRDMGEANVNRLTEIMPQYNRQLVLWALGGIGGEGNQETQWARFLLTYDNNDGSTSSHTIDDYCSRLLSGKISGTFGTPFTWSYQGTRGTNIQLSSKILK